jgi:hypothetical protein
MELDKKIEWLKKEIDFCKEQEEIYAFRKEVAEKECWNLTAEKLRINIGKEPTAIEVLQAQEKMKDLL